MYFSALFYLALLILLNVFLFFIRIIRFILEVNEAIAKWFLKYDVFWIIVFVISISNIWSKSRLDLSILNLLKLRCRLIKFDGSCLRNSRNMFARNLGQLSFLLWTSALIVFAWLNINLLIINRALVRAFIYIFVHI